jgi:sporulation protein YlmC with PRC-barrel domain
METETREFVGKEVVGFDGWNIGKIKDVIIDVDAWQVPSLYVKLESRVANEFGMKQRFRSTHIPLDASYIQGIGDRVTLKISKDQLRDIMATYLPKNQEPEVSQMIRAEIRVPLIF